jgi:hypothetical protein
MQGRTFIIPFAGFAVVFGAALWYFQTEAYYAPVIGLDTVDVQGAALPVTDYDGIDADTSPLKLRACFVAAPATVAALAALPQAQEPTPLVTPAWFACFNAGALSDELASGGLRAVVVAHDEPWGFDRIVASAPDGRAVMWRQTNPCGVAQYNGDPLPDRCPPPPAN